LENNPDKQNAFSRLPFHCLKEATQRLAAANDETAHPLRKEIAKGKSVIRTIFLLALLAAFPPLSTDMYLPAIPLLKEQWQQPLVVVNLTLVCFFLTYCLLMLFYGPLSDRFGRRRPLLVGLTIFIIGSLVCAISNGVLALIAARVLQASGAAAATALSLAMCKDLFEASERERIMAHIAVIMSLAPMLGPVIGGWIISAVSWRWVFVIQAILGAIAWGGVLRMTESLKRFQPVTLSGAALAYLRLFRNGRFVGLLFTLSLLVLPIFAFIAAATDIYMGRFGLDERQFGYLFGFNAIAIMCGPIAFARLSRFFSSAALMTTAFAGATLSGGALVLLPHNSPWSLALPMWCLCFCFGLSRPPSNNLLLEQVEADVGAASALITFTYMTIGALSMGGISFDWPDKITVLGGLGASMGALTLIIWIRYKHLFLKALSKKAASFSPDRGRIP
jgi:MFS transporter, DHA1 family, multidrug resistance protein